MKRSTTFRRTALWAAATLPLLLAACGGGGDGGGGGSAPITFAVDPATITPVAGSTDQPFQNTSALEFVAYGGTCRSTAVGQAVLVTDNAVTYNDGTASAAQMKRVAQYAEASVRTLRARFGITAPGNVGFDGQKLRVCAAVNGSSSQTNGSAGIRTLQVGAPEGYGGLDALVLHEMVHLVQAQALNCQTQQYGWERWFNEGMALHIAGQDLPSPGELSSLRTAFSAFDGQLPFGDMNQRPSVDFARFPGYRLAVDTLLGETGKTEVDLYRFLKQVGDTSGCPGADAPYTGDPVRGWKPAFDAAFGTDLRGSGVAGSGFWALAAKYAH